MEISRHNATTPTRLVRAPKLDRDANAALARIVRAGGAEADRARDDMVIGNMRLVYFATRRYPAGILPLEDMLQEGSIGLMRAINKFDPDRGVSFSSYAIFWVRAMIERALYQNDCMIYIPANVVSSVRRLQRIEATGGTLTPRETQDTLAIGVESIEMARKAMVPTLALDMKYNDGESTLMDFIPDADAPSPETQAALRDVWQQTTDCPTLTDRERTILGLFSLGEVHQDIGDTYGITRERVRQIIASAMNKVRVHIGIQP